MLDTFADVTCRETMLYRRYVETSRNVVSVMVVQLQSVYFYRKFAYNSIYIHINVENKAIVNIVNFNLITRKDSVCCYQIYYLFDDSDVMFYL